MIEILIEIMTALAVVLAYDVFVLTHARHEIRKTTLLSVSKLEVSHIFQRATIRNLTDRVQQLETEVSELEKNQ